MTNRPPHRDCCVCRGHGWFWGGERGEKQEDCDCYDAYQEEVERRMKDIKAKAKAAEKARNGRHSDVKEDRAMIKSMVKPAALTGKAKGGPATKGKTHGKGLSKGKGKTKTQVNVLVAPDKGASAAPALPAMATPGPAMPPSALPAAGAGMPIRKKGGRVKKADGGGVKHVISDGAGGGKGRLEKIGAYGPK